jgi:ribosomal protein L11 methyltransferase
MTAAAAPLVRLGIRVRRDRAEEALAALLPLLGAGAEETEPGDAEVEYAVYATSAELPSPEEVRALVGDALVALHRSEVPDGWERRWHEHLRPVEVAAAGRRLRLRAPWLPAGPDDGTPELLIDPGASFGAGGHATTRICLALLLGLEPAGPLADWGAGSGVLALAAARLGWSPVQAVELDPAALAAIAANAAANAADVAIHPVDLAAGEPPWAPTVCANLTLELQLAIAARLTRPPERLIAAGMLAARADAVAAAYAVHGLRETARLHDDDWAALLLERSP